MPDKPMAEECPLISRKKAYEILFDFYGVFLGRQPEQLGKPRHMRVHHDSFVFAERISKNDIGRFA
jgi:hypothetical protein